jgi:predicted nucleic acid-binding protein
MSIYWFMPIRRDSERHLKIREWLESALDEPEGVAISELVLSGCLRVITHPKFASGLQSDLHAHYSILETV